jgi:menaquinone-dependent protoporphyrinogen oxidase
MKTLLIVYATREGQTRRVTAHLSELLQRRGILVECANAASLSPDFQLGRHYAGVIVAGSVHAGHHEHELVAFARRHRAELDAVPNAFVSVSLSQGSAQDAAVPDPIRASATAQVRKALDGFIAESGWSPRRVIPVAGALRYRRYGRLLRFVIRIAAKAYGLSTDVWHDHVYTNWAVLDDLAIQMAREVQDALASHASAGEPQHA